MNDKQRIKLMGTWWPDACDAQKWDAGNREFRIAKIGELIGRDIQSCTELTNADFDKLVPALKLLARPDSLSAARATVDSDEAGQRRRYLHFINQHFDSGMQEIVYDVSRKTTTDPDELTTPRLSLVVQRYQSWARKVKRERLDRELAEIPF